MSLVVNCDTQEDIDRLWKALTEKGGAESRCGWCRDRFGLSWQVVPRRLGEMLSDPDRARAQRVVGAFMPMTKLVLADLERAWGAMLVPDKIEASLLKDCSGSKVSPMVSRLRAALARGLAPGRMGLYFDDGGTHRHKRYAVPLGPAAIELVAPEERAGARTRGLGRGGKLAEPGGGGGGLDTLVAPGALLPGDDR